MIGLLRPFRVAPRVTEIDARALRAEGIDGAIVDLDNTLLAYGAREVLAEERAWVTSALAAGLRVVVLTNNGQRWAHVLAESLGVPCIGNARKPLPRAFRRALGVLELPRERVVVVGDQLFTDVLGARVAGLRAILVPAMVAHDPWNTRPLRWLERLLS